MKRSIVLALWFAAAGEAEIHVPASAALANAETKPQPEYNPIARQMHITGDVSVELQVSQAGEVAAVKVLAGNALLAGPVVKAVKNWKFKPFLAEGQPSAAVTVLRFSFK
jgi:periplasmic protein TonB